MGADCLKLAQGRFLYTWRPCMYVYICISCICVLLLSIRVENDTIINIVLYLRVETLLARNSQNIQYSRVHRLQKTRFILSRRFRRILEFLTRILNIFLLRTIILSFISSHYDFLYFLLLNAFCFFFPSFLLIFWSVLQVFSFV